MLKHDKHDRYKWILLCGFQPRNHISAFHEIDNKKSKRALWSRKQFLIPRRHWQRPLKNKVRTRHCVEWNWLDISILTMKKVLAAESIEASSGKTYALQAVLIDKQESELQNNARNIEHGTPRWRSRKMITRETRRSRLFIGPSERGLRLCLTRKLTGRLMSAGRESLLLMSWNDINLCRHKINYWK